MKHYFLWLVLLFLITACDQIDMTNSDSPAPPILASGISKENMNLSVKPGDDFMQHVNGTWIDATEIPADKGSYGSFTFLRDESEEHVKSIIEDSASNKHPSGTDARKVGDLYQSYMNLEERNRLGLSPLQTRFEQIDAISNIDDLVSFVVRGIQLGNNPLVNSYVMPDLKEPTVYAFYTGQGRLGLPDREYYLKENERYSDIRSKYVQHVQNMLRLAGIKEAATAAQAIMSLETKIAKIHMPKEDRRDPDKAYNPYTAQELDDLTPEFNWKLFLEKIGAGDQEKIIVTQVEFFRELNALLLEIDLATWKVWFKWTHINTNATYLNEDLDQQNFSFYGTVMRGTKEQRKLWRRAVSQVNEYLGEAVGKVYVQKHFPPEAKERMQGLVANLIKTYEDSIKSLIWMGDDTKLAALKKLEKFDPKIGYPDKWKDYSSLEISVSDFYGNIQRANEFDYRRNIEKLGKPIDKTEWSMNPQTVNAYYNPTKNEIVFPAGILQPPFFDMSADDAVNYGAIGAVIGHEIGHGFDDKGSKFDGDGMLRNWWTDKDREEFNKRTSKLVAQYDSYTVFDDLNVNGTYTLGENIGDLGGLTIALKAYRLSLKGKEAPVMDGYTGMQRFFIGYAQVWLKKSREKTLRRQVGTDPHSPAKFRLNGTVRNIPEFYKAFNVTVGDKLYLQEEDRVKIW